jgi:hypothetical protein
VYGPLPAPPRPPRPHLGLRVTLGVLLVVALGLGAGNSVLFLSSLGTGQPGTTFVAGDQGLIDLLSRRAAAVTRHDEAAFLADVDQEEPRFVERQRTEYRNLVALGLATFSLTLTEPDRYRPANDSPLLRRYGGLVRQVGVTVKYAVTGVDTEPEAEPWIPTFGFAHGRWLLAGEETAGGNRGLPFGAGGQPWEARPVSVVRAAHVVVVTSKEDAGIAPHLVDLAERGVANVLRFRTAGWPGKALVTAVSDQKVFDSYFESSPDKLSDIEAVAIPRYNEVPEWDGKAWVVLSRVVFNPATLGTGDEQLQHTFTHELTHVALGSVTTESTPRWLVEGMAEYVAYASEDMPDSVVRQYARHVSATQLPPDGSFYDTADNYFLSWLAVRMIAVRYGQAKAFALYEWFKDHSDTDAGLHAVLGTSLSGVTAAWLAYLDQMRKA